MWRRKAFEMPDKTYYSAAQVLKATPRRVSPQMTSTLKFML